MQTRRKRAKRQPQDERKDACPLVSSVVTQQSVKVLRLPACPRRMLLGDGSPLMCETVIGDHVGKLMLSSCALSQVGT